MEELKNVHYDAFISYRHCELDSFVAERIHKKLEAFRLPKAVRKKVTNGKTKIERIFRDLEELPLSDNLMDPITNALNNSDYLITICSPRYLESIWCMKEVEVFLENHDREHVLVILVEGEPNESFPKILTFEEITTTDENGNTVITRRELEPLAADVRSDNKKNLLKAIDIAVIKLSAEIFGLNYDDLRRRHRANKIRKMIIIFGSIAGVQLIFVIIVSIMLIKISNQKDQIQKQNDQMTEQNKLITEQNVEIQDQYNELQDKYAASMATVSETLMGQGKRKDAAYALRSVLPDKMGDGYNPQALKSLYSVMNPYDVSGRMTPNTMYVMEGEIQSYSVSNDGNLILINDGQNICVFDVKTGNLIKKIVRNNTVNNNDTRPENDMFDDYVFTAEFCGNDGLLVINEDDISYMSISGNDVRKIDFISRYSEFIKSDDKNIVFAISDCEIQGIDSNGNLLYSIDLEEEFNDNYFELGNADFENGNAFFCFTGYELYFNIIFNEETGEIISVYSDNDSFKVAGVLDGDMLYYFHATLPNSKGYASFVISAYNYEKGLFLWSIYLENAAISDIEVSDEHLYLSESTSVFALDKFTGSLRNYYYLESTYIKGWCNEDILYFINYDCMIHYCTPNINIDYTDSFFVNSPTSKIISAVYENDGLFCQFNEKNYITYYSQNDNPEITETGYDTENAFKIELPADNALENVSDINYRMITESFYSDDGKYIFANFSDHTCKIFDASSLKEICSFEAETSHYISLKHSGLTGSYILNGKYDSFILDKDFNVICSLERILAEDDGRFITMNIRKDCFLVPYVSYDDLINLTDAYLDGYAPSNSIKQKYQLK